MGASVLDRLTLTLREMATWPVVLLLVVGFATCRAGFVWRERALGLEETTFDMRVLGYDGKEAGDLLDKMEGRGRSLYAVTQLSLDVAFPVVYGLLAAILIAWLYPQPWARWLILLPLLAVALDLCENVTTATMAWRHETGTEPPLAGLASTLTVAKWCGVLGGLATLVVAWLVGKLRG